MRKVLTSKVRIRIGGAIATCDIEHSVESEGHRRTVVTIAWPLKDCATANEFDLARSDRIRIEFKSFDTRVLDAVDTLVEADEDERSFRKFRIKAQVVMDSIRLGLDDRLLSCRTDTIGITEGMLETKEFRGSIRILLCDHPNKV